MINLSYAMAAALVCVMKACWNRLLPVQKNFYAYGEKDICMLAAAYAEGIARNHPFVDGNKRTAYAVAGLFLFLNGLALQIPDTKEQITLFENVAAGHVSKEELAEFYRSNTTPA
jgi:death-on-curing protein